MTLPAYLALLLWTAMLVLVGTVNERLLARIFSGGGHRAFIWLGVVVHEASHWLACVLTGTRVYEVRVFERSGGYVRHERRGPVVMALIGLAPVLGCSLFMVFLVYLFGHAGVRFEASGIELGDPLASMWALLASAAGTLWTNLVALGPSTLLFLFFLYLVWSVAACLAPSRPDLRHAAAGALVLSAAGALVVHLRPLSPLGVEGTPALDFLALRLTEAVGLGLLVSLIPLIIALPLALLRPG